MLDAVARTGSVTQAAAMLHMTGPAVSQQLRRIEAEAGRKVVIPDGRGVRLTSEGRILADYAAQVAGLMQRAENDLRHTDELVGHVCVGALASIIRGTLIHTLPSFQRRYPRVDLRVEDGETAWHLDRLAGGRLDVVLAESWSPAPLRLPSGVTAHRLAREPAWVALPDQHPRRENQRFAIADLADEAWVTCARDSDGHVALAQAARRSGVELDIRHFVADHATQLALVRSGLGLACLPRPEDAAASPNIVYRRLAPAMHRDIVMLTSDRTPSRAVEALTAHLAAAYQDQNSHAPGPTTSRDGG